jgi:S1-C subfamily serine protease
MSPWSEISAQDDVENSQDQIVLGQDSILGEESADPEEKMSLLVDKSAMSDLEFLALGDAPTSIEQLKAMQEHVAELNQQVSPAVVNIQSGSGQGSGVVVTSDGYILTAAHVIGTPNRGALITFPDGTKARAQTLGLHRTLDAGILRIYQMIPTVNVEEEEAESPEEDNSGSEESPSQDDEGEKEDGSEEQDSGSEDLEPEQQSEEGEDEPKGAGDEKTDQEPAEDSQEEKDETDSDDKQSEDTEKDDSDSGTDDEEDAKPRRRREPFKIQDDLPSFPYLEIGDSAELNLGQWVIAVGHPGGLDMDRGLVLRVGRINEITGDTLRTDCTLVGGDSGGPLIGMDGSVIGIHSRIGGRLRENFHVPSNEYLDKWSELTEPIVLDGEPDLGLSVRGASNVIEKISPRSFAGRSGLKENDRIIRVGDKEIYDKIQLDDAISDLKPYQKIEFEVQRKGKKKVLDVTIGEKRSMMRFR